MQISLTATLIENTPEGIAHEVALTPERIAELGITDGHVEEYLIDLLSRREPHDDRFYVNFETLDVLVGTPTESEN